MSRPLSEEDSPIAEINIIPFVDIILVILIIFMVATPFLVKTGLSLKLPETGFSQPITTSKINIMVQKTGMILLNGKPVDLDHLGIQLKQVSEASFETPVIISADKNILHGKVVSIISIAQSMGFKKVAIATSQASASEEKLKAPENLNK